MTIETSNEIGEVQEPAYAPGSAEDLSYQRGYRDGLEDATTELEQLQDRSGL